MYHLRIHLKLLVPKPVLRQKKKPSLKLLLKVIDTVIHLHKFHALCLYRASSYTEIPHHMFSFIFLYGVDENLDFLNDDENVEKPLEEDPNLLEDVPQNEDDDIGSGENPIPENDEIETEAEEEAESNTIIGNMTLFQNN